jgi:hypothetical protein
MECCRTELRTIAGALRIAWGMPSWAMLLSRKRDAARLSGRSVSLLSFQSMSWLARAVAGALFASRRLATRKSFDNSIQRNSQ